MPIKMANLLSYRASVPTHSISHGTHCSLCLPLDRLSHSSGGGALSPCLHMPFIRASHSSVPSLPKSFCDGGSSGVSSPHHALLSAQSFNASGFTVVAFTALPASSTLVVLLVGVGVAFTSNDAPSSLCTSIIMCLTAFAPAFLAAWAGPRPTPPASSRGPLHKLDGFKASRQGLMVCHTGAVPSPGMMPHVGVLSNSRKGKGF